MASDSEEIKANESDKKGLAHLFMKLNEN